MSKPESKTHSDPHSSHPKHHRPHAAHTSKKHARGRRHPGHAHSHAHSIHNTAPRAISHAILITLIFMVIELLGGWFSNSLALISDGAHMLTDVGAMSLSLFALWIARRPATSTMTFGYHRAEILGALFSGLLIWLISGVLIYESIDRLHSPPEVKGPVVFGVATLGLIANAVCMWTLHGAKEENLNVKAAYLHVLSDLMGSVGAIIAGAVLWITNWKPIDPLLTILFSLLMLFNSWSLVKEAAGILMESAPTHLDPESILQDLRAIDSVLEVHDLHVWSVSNGKPALSAHLITMNGEHVLSTAHELLRTKYEILHSTLQIEHPEKFRSQQCYHCKPQHEVT
jgi:cobalt-zinc-cadmium efflux system protein